MTIRAPQDFTSYIQSIALQHPDVMCVIIGDMSRSEAGTTSTNSYPLILIEWPSVRRPRSQGPMKMYGRVFVLGTAPDALYAEEDALIASTYQIAINLVAIIQEHSYGNDYEFTLSADEMTIDPVAYLGSDQQRGWVFQVEMEVDQSMCHDMDHGVDYMSVPSFAWAYKASLSFENTSIIGPAVESQTWYWQDDIDQPDPIEFNPDDGISPSVLSDPDPDMPDRILQVWLLLTLHNGTRLWAYAGINLSEFGPGDNNGVSTNVIPSYPI